MKGATTVTRRLRVYAITPRSRRSLRPAPPPRGCHLYFARRVTSLPCADSVAAFHLGVADNPALVGDGTDVTKQRGARGDG